MDCSGFAAVQFPTLPIRPQTASSKTRKFLGFDGTGMGYQVPITCLTCKGSQVQVLVRPPNYLSTDRRTSCAVRQVAYLLRKSSRANSRANR